MDDFQAQNLANTVWTFSTVGFSDVPLFSALERASELRIGEFNAQGFANTAWAFAKAVLSDTPLFAVFAKVVERHVDDFNAQGITNTAWAFATAGQLDALLSLALARATEQSIGDFSVQSLANTAWAFATTGQPDVPLFSALARAAEWRIFDFKAQGLANTTWGFATAGEPAPSLMDPLLVLDAIEAQDTKPQVMSYHMSVQSLATAGEFEAAFALLARVEAVGLLLVSDDSCFKIFRTFLEACRSACESGGASRVQAAMERLGLIALAPVAVALEQGLEQYYENGASGQGVADAQHLCAELCRRKAYTPQLQALPWGFVQNSTRSQQETSLQVHARRRWVCSSRGEAKLTVSTEFHGCMDCRDFLERTLLLRGRRIKLSRISDTFTNGCRSRNDWWHTG